MEKDFGFSPPPQDKPGDLAPPPPLLPAPEDLTQARLQQIANEIGDPIEKLVGGGTADIIRILNPETGTYSRTRGRAEIEPSGDLRSSWAHSKKLVELRQERATLLPNKLRAVN